jgi:sulfoquinovose isomerase
MTSWLESPGHLDWLQGETRRLLAFGTGIVNGPTGAAWLDYRGRPVTDRPKELYLTCRAVHVYALGQLIGIPGCRSVAERAVAALRGPFRDPVHDGWFHQLSTAGEPVLEKAAYDHAFVILAGSSAAQARLAGGTELLQAGLAIFERRFWDESTGLSVETWDASFSRLDDYRGLNSNMHAVEAFLAAGDVTGNPLWVVRAARIAAFAIDQASRHNWRLPEHYDANWTVQLDHNIDCRFDQFQPYGATVGHGFEWSRLLLHLEASLANLGEIRSTQVDWLGAAIALFDRAAQDGWAVGGTPGFIYTTDWDGRPVVRDRLHWVAAEAVAAAAALANRTRLDDYADRYAEWWDYIAQVLLDLEQGSWHHELDANNRPSGRVWPGKPDLYHALQATLIPRLPLAPSIATAIANGMLDGAHHRAAPPRPAAQQHAAAPR